MSVLGRLGLTPLVRCWVCLGKGHVRGLEGPMACPNPHCRHVQDGKRS